jgi:hypothetical protein
MHAISYAWSVPVADTLRNLFLLKWEAINDNNVKVVVAHFRKEWCNPRLSKWCGGHAHNCVVNTNGLEATNKVVKDEVTLHQLLPVMDFLAKASVWVSEHSIRRDTVVGNSLKFVTQHTFSTKDWIEAYAWKNNKSKQLRITVNSAYVAVEPGTAGNLTDEKASRYYNMFLNATWPSYDSYTSVYHKVSVLFPDNSRPEGYSCTCCRNSKEFHCVHSLGVAIYRGTMQCDIAAVKMLGRKRKRGRQPQAAPAWDFMPFNLHSPVDHPQQDPDLINGNNAIEGEVAANLAEDLAVEQ